MYNQTQVENHLKSLVAYAVNNGKDQAKMNNLVIPLQNSIKSYFEVDFSKYVESCIEAMIHAGIRIGIKYKDFRLTTGQFAPSYYDDVRELVMWIDDFMSITNTEFLNSITESVDIETASITYQSALVDKWVYGWDDGLTNVTASFLEIFRYACQMGMNNTMELLLESPKIESVPQLSEIARDIYITKHYKEFIEFYGLNVYVKGGLDG